MIIDIKAADRHNIACVYTHQYSLCLKIGVVGVLQVSKISYLKKVLIFASLRKVLYP